MSEALYLGAEPLDLNPHPAGLLAVGPLTPGTRRRIEVAGDWLLVPFTNLPDSPGLLEYAIQLDDSQPMPFPVSNAFVRTRPFRYVTVHNISLLGTFTVRFLVGSGDVFFVGGG